MSELESVRPFVRLFIKKTVIVRELFFWKSADKTEEFLKVV